MRIGLFTDSYPPYINGVATSVYNLRKSLIKLGHTVYLVTVNNKFKTEYDEDEKILKIASVPSGLYDYRIGNFYPVSIINEIKNWNLDVIHSHTEFGIGIFARIISKKFKIPLVHTYHTLYEDYTHYITHNHFDKLSKTIVKKVTKIYCGKSVKRVIVPTEKINNLFKNKYNITNNIDVIPSGIDLDKFSENIVNKTKVSKIKEKYCIKKNDFVVIFVGRIAQEKNIDFLLQAHEKLTSIDKNIKLLIVGDGPDKNKYVNLVNESSLSDKIIFTGKVSQDEIENYYRVAKVFVTASTTETQGLTVIEAIASNLIPLCINDKAFNKILSKKNLFNNEKEYIEKLLKFVADEDLRIKCINSDKKIIDKFSMEEYASKIINTYNEVVSTKEIS